MLKSLTMANRTNHEYSIEGDGLAPDETLTVNFTGSQTEVGSSDNTYSIDWGDTNKDNYNVTEKTGTLKTRGRHTPNVGAPELA